MSPFMAHQGGGGPRGYPGDNRRFPFFKSDRSDRNNVLEKLIPVAENEISRRMQWTGCEAAIQKFQFTLQVMSLAGLVAHRTRIRASSAFCSRLRADCVQRLETKRLTSF